MVDSRAAENVMPRSMFPEIGIRQTERSKNGKGFKGAGRENIKNCGQQVMAVRTPEGFVRKNTWQKASGVGEAGNDLFIWMDEACIMNRKKKEKSMLRKEGNVYVLDMFVRVPRLTQSTKSQTDGSRGRESRSTATAGGVSVEDRSKRTETVRAQSNERCEKRQGCDSVLSATNDENDVELNGEMMRTRRTEKWDLTTEVCRKNIRDPGQPTVKELQEHMTNTSTVQIMVQVLCDGTRGERTAQEIGRSRRFGWSSPLVDGLWVLWGKGFRIADISGHP